MTTLARDTPTTPQVEALLPADTFLAEAMPEVERLLGRHDPTRVRLTGLRPAEWAQDAACDGQATGADDPWHPGTPGDVGRFSARTRQVCHGCPVRAECLALGLAMIPLGGSWGMFGGYTPAELRAIARALGMAERVVAQHGSRARYTAGCDCAPCTRAHNVEVKRLRDEARDPDAPLVLEHTPAPEVPEADLLSLLREVS